MQKSWTRWGAGCVAILSSPALAAASATLVSSGERESTAVLPADEIEARWGALWTFADKDLVCTCDPRQVSLLRWDTPGEVLRIIGHDAYGPTLAVFRIGPDGRGTYDSYRVKIEKDGTLAPEGTLAKYNLPWRVEADGSVVVSGLGAAGKPESIQSIRYRADGEQLALDRNRSGQWEVHLARREIRAADAKAERLAAELRQRVGLTPAGTTRLADTLAAAPASEGIAHQDASPGLVAQAASLAPATTDVNKDQATNSGPTEPAKDWTDSEIAVRWGTLALLPGSEWRWNYSQTAFDDVSYRWVRRGEVMAESLLKGLSADRGVIATYEFQADGSIIRNLSREGLNDERLTVRPDGSVLWAYGLSGRPAGRIIRSEGAEIAIYAQRPGECPSLLRGTVLTRADSKAPGGKTAPVAPAAAEIENGVFDLVDGKDTIALASHRDSICASDATGRLEFRCQADGTFHHFNKKDEKVLGIKIVDPITIEVESFETERADSAPARYVRRNGASSQAQELVYGWYTYVDPDSKGGLVVLVDGDKAVTATPDFTSEYQRQPDGTFLHHGSDGKTYGLRVQNMYTVEVYALPKTVPTVLARRGDAPSTYIADVRQNNEIRRRRAQEERYLAQLEEEAWEAEEAAAEAEMAYEEEAYGSSGGSTGTNILQGFMKGWGEATASNDAMQRSMEDAANRGLAEGAAEYARRQAELAREEAERRRADIEHARRVREQEEAARRSRQVTAQARAAELARAADAEARRERELKLATRSDGGGAAENPARDAGPASTDTDATICVQGPVVGPNPAMKGATLATVINGCPTPVDVRLCLMGENGWDCGTSYGVKRQEKGSYWRSKSSGEIFWDARTSGSSKPLRSPG